MAPSHIEQFFFFFGSILLKRLTSIHHIKTGYDQNNFFFLMWSRSYPIYMKCMPQRFHVNFRPNLSHIIHNSKWPITISEFRNNIQKHIFSIAEMDFFFLASHGMSITQSVLLLKSCCMFKLFRILDSFLVNFFCEQKYFFGN